MDNKRVNLNSLVISPICSILTTASFLNNQLCADDISMWQFTPISDVLGGSMNYTLA